MIVYDCRLRLCCVCDELKPQTWAYRCFRLRNREHFSLIEDGQTQ